MLKVSGITKKYKTVTALDNVTVTFPDKGLVAILGESGSGKSTLFHVLTGAVKPDCGEVLYNGEKLNTDGKINSKGIFGVIFQDGNLLEGLSVSDNLSICRKDSQKQRDMLSALGIERYFNSKAGRISGGEQQRTAIARALLDESSVLLADEPTGSLDEKNGENVMSLLKEISREKLVLVITHNTYFAEKYADGIVKLEKGKIVRTDGEIFESGQAAENAAPANAKPQRRMSASFIFKFCAAKMKRGFIKHLTSIIILAVTLALVVLPLSLMTTNCLGDYLDSIKDYTYSALYDDRNVPEFEQKLQGADMDGLYRYYPLNTGTASMVIEDDSLEPGEVILGADAAEWFNKDRAFPLAKGDTISFVREEFTVAGFADKVNAELPLNFNGAVYLNGDDLHRVLRWSGKSLTDKNHYRIFDVETDDTLADGECKLNFRLYYSLASEFPEFFDLKKNSVTWAFEKQNGQGLFALVYSKDFKIVGVTGNSPDESETSVLYVNSAERERIIGSLSYYHGYFFKTADRDIINYWLDRGVDIFNYGYEEYTRAQAFKDSFMPYAAAMLAVGVVLGGLYMTAVQSHIALINRREIYILKSLRVGGGSLFAILLVQFLPVLLCANIIASCVFGIVARVIVMHYYPYMFFNVLGGAFITLAVSLLTAIAATAFKVARLNKKFDVSLTR